MDCSPPGFSVHGILQARTLEWVAISFSNAWKWKVKVKPLSHVWLLATPWTAACQAPPSVGFSRQEYWSGVPLPSPSLTWYTRKKKSSLIYLHYLKPSLHMVCFKLHMAWTSHSSSDFQAIPWLYAFACAYFSVEWFFYFSCLVSFIQPSRLNSCKSQLLRDFIGFSRLASLVHVSSLLVKSLITLMWPPPSYVKGLCCAVLYLSSQLCLTLCNAMTIARQAPLSMGILQARILEWVILPSSSLGDYASMYNRIQTCSPQQFYWRKVKGLNAGTENQNFPPLPPPPTPTSLRASFLSPEISLETSLLMKATYLCDFQNVIASVGI